MHYVNLDGTVMPDMTYEEAVRIVLDTAMEGVVDPLDATADRDLARVRDRQAEVIDWCAFFLLNNVDLLRRLSPPDRLADHVSTSGRETTAESDPSDCLIFLADIAESGLPDGSQEATDEHDAFDRHRRMQAVDMIHDLVVRHGRELAPAPAGPRP